jgi:hypothetical protein
MDNKYNLWQADRVKLESQIKKGANWFYWIAALSIVNSIVAQTGSQWNFIVGLGITQLVDGIAVLTGLTVSMTARILLLGFDLIVAGIFAFFGIFANKKHSWAFIVGMVLYALDGLIFLLSVSILSIGFHGYVLFCLYAGLSAAMKLSKMDKEPMAQPYAAGYGYGVSPEMPSMGTPANPGMNANASAPGNISDNMPGSESSDSR